MKELLSELAQQVRGSTLELLQAAPETWLTWAPAGTSNHILWHAGHALWLQDLLCVELLTGNSELPEGWPAMFGQHCRPVASTSRWPPRTQVATLLTVQLQRVLELIEDVDARQLTSPLAGAQKDARGRMIHGWHDEARHQGEMYLLLKLRRAVDARRS